MGIRLWLDPFKPLAWWFSQARYWENLRAWCDAQRADKAEPPEKSNQ